MKIRPSVPDDHDGLVDIWLRSVRASHSFLTEADIQSLLPIVKNQALSNLELWVLCSDEGVAIGFMGISEVAIEALFIAPEHRRRGGGRILVLHAQYLKGALSVDVNEQNPKAIKFYMAQDFKIVGRSPHDSDGRPFPIIHMMKKT